MEVWIKDSINITARWKPSHLLPDTKGEEADLVPSIEDLQKKSLEQIKEIRLTKVRWSDDGHKLYNLQFTFDKDVTCPVSGTYENDPENEFSMPEFRQVGKIEIGVV